MKKASLKNFGKLIFLVLVLIFVSYVTYFKPKASEAQPELEEPEITFNSQQANYTLQDSIVQYGMELLGTPYVVAGNGEEGFDCSGYVYFVYQHFNIDVPRSSAAFENFGREVPIEQVEKGDLLLFLSPTRDAIGHIGIVSEANGVESDFIHATSGRQMKVVITNLSNQGYTRRFVKAIRVI
ncbi:NlpC/P60 family protein [Antarcticibacterium arcticum]|uniref:NlpC/P60 family protein n=1 Tax=Antarcticibacterium arcticum TaxID=2585771 RepID=A0A5B8YID4_9FLAO|nr:C40 family peptidase [Antarcticibacterium arcticum]QED37381.1 NlpC/P60 family protein [Antarcticibacterium arcticum]